MSTATTQPEPLQLAEWLDFWSQPTAKKAAAALRRLHAENQQLRADLEAVGAGGIGPLIPATVQHQHKPSRDNDLQRENGHLITSSSTAPAGWRLVPVEPTPEMLRAAIDAPRPAVYVDSLSAAENLINSTKYRAMLAAAPQPPGGQEPDWQDLYRKEKRRAEMWIAKYEQDIGKLEVAVPVAARPPSVAARTCANCLHNSPPFGNCDGCSQQNDDADDEGNWEPIPEPQGEQEPALVVAYDKQGWGQMLDDMREIPDGTPLYTHPQPKREPLKKEEIDRIINDLDPIFLDTPTGFEEEFCRAIERAHGIGGEA